MQMAELILTAKTDGLRRARGDLDELRNSGERTEKGLTGSMGKVSSGFADAAKAAGALAAAVGVGSALNKAIADARGFSRGLAEVSTLIEGTPAQMDALAAASKNLAATFGTTSQNQVEAFYQAISAGAGTVEEATAVLDAANRFAVGGVTNVTTGVDALTTAMNAYAATGLTAAQASDALFVGIRGGKTTADELAASLGNIAPIASSAGVSFDEIVAATAALTTQGLGTSEAVTGLRQVLSGIIKPTSEAAKEAERLGLAFSSQALADQGLSAFLTEVIEKTGGSQESMAQLFGSVEALNAVLSMAGGGGEAFNAIMAEMEVKAGATTAAYDKLADSADNRLSVATSQMSVALLEVGEVVLPMLVPLVQAVATAVVNLSANMDEIGPVLAAAGVAFAALAAPVTAIGVALAATAVVVINNWDEIKQAFSSAEDFRAALDKIVGYVSDLGGMLVSALKAAGIAALGAAKQIGVDIVDGIKAGLSQKFSDLKDSVTGLGSSTIQWMKQAVGSNSPATEFMPIGSDIVEGLGIGIMDNAYYATDAIGQVVDYMFSGFRDGMKGILNIFVNSLKSMAAAAIGNPIKIAFTTALTGGAGAAAAGVPGGGGMLSNLLPGVFGGGGALSGIGSGLMGVFSGGGLGSSFANLGGLLSGSVSGWGAVGAALPAAGLLVGVPLLIGALMKKTEVLVAEGVRARIDGATLELDSYDKTKTNNGFGFSSGFSRDFDRLDDAVQSAVGARLDATIDALGAFGLGTDLTGFSFSKRTEIKDGETFEGESEEVIREALSAAIEYATGGALDAFTRSGEDMAGTLERLVTSLNSVNPILATLGDNILPLSLDGAAAASALADLAGGLEAFGSKAAFIFGNFLTDQERLNFATQQLNATFGAMSVALPETHAQFRALMEAQDLTTEAGRQLYTALLDVAPLFVEVKGTAQDAAGALAEVAAQNSAVTTAMSNLRAAIAAEVSPLQDQLRVAQDAMRESERVANALRGALRNMRTESQRATVRASAQATLRDMLTGNRVTDTEAFRDALSVVQEPSENLFGSFVEYQRDFYRTANLISSLETKADRQLSADQRTASGIETQISQLNALIGRYDTQISATMSVANAVRSLEDALTAQQEAATAASPASREDAYLAANPDVAAAVAAGMFSSGAEHFALHGQFEDRPAFANGGMHTGGVRLVGERGPELEATGPARIYSARQTKEMLHDDVLRKEVREMKEYIRELVKINIKQERALKEIEIQGETA